MRAVIVSCQVVFVACALPGVDAGSLLDAGEAHDAGASDGGTRDAGTPDAGARFDGGAPVADAGEGCPPDWVDEGFGGCARWVEGPAMEVGATASWFVRDGDDLVVFTGGGLLSDGGQTKVDALDLTTLTWRALAPMPNALVGHDAFVLGGGRMLAMPNVALGVAHVPRLLDDDDAGWRSGAVDPIVRNLAAACLLDDRRVLVTGGGPGFGGPAVATSHVYDAVDDAWVPVADLPRARMRHGCVVLDDGRVLVAGGVTSSSGNPANRVLEAALYTDDAGWIETNAVTGGGELPVLLMLVDGRALLAAGNAGGGGADVFDPTTNAWTATGPTGSAFYDYPRAGVVLGDGRALVVGDGAELYDPSTNVWALTADPPGRDHSTAAALLDDGRAILVGAATLIYERLP